MKTVSRVSLLIWVFLLLTVAQLHAAKAPKKSKKDEVVTISTSLGDIRLILFDQTPLHKANFLKLAKSGFYTGTTFHRIIQNFMVQGGDANSKDTDPTNDGQGQPNEATIPAEIRPELQHKFGAVAAARQGDFVNPTRASSATQFYIVQNHNGTPHLNAAYTVFGQVISGLEVVDKIAAQPKNDSDRPTTDIKMTVKVEKLKKKKITALYGYKYE
ncbi:peptidyl-prolyl cis-trans isomerase B (cyclophilin B) [Hymenobacter daecheongensis DSM 21074]|uniref:Peptidyl-prolyl cis-trans isomerase n=1 Tax=Hymenobacter daecheongensis DSM 21074 TaxID=1121955 RepID=A0A1M6CX29_9BACT|nr:peptidylprolyl isomerase [Hymenobacter daecheongensis]SHI65510.1 peptidyl-prolyl cis-trans isomerase B (cyclophilin B) [Hymenobacter daecheongensis DSM 21074]